MTRSLSVYLNILRSCAALAVVLSHIDYRGIGGHAFAAVKMSGIGHQAVMVFFVLSGYVIAQSAARTKALHQYATARLARLYAVIVPLVVVLPLLHAIGQRIDPGVYALTPGFFDTPPLLGALHTLAFSSEFGVESHRYYGNIPLWSLSYEVAYYALFGLAIYLRGVTRVVAMTLLALLIGPKILLLMPIWLLGVLLYHRREALRFSRTGGLALMAASIILYAAYARVHTPIDQATFEVWTAIGVNPHQTLGWSKYFLTDYILGAIVGLNLIGASSYFGDDVSFPAPLVALSQWLADRSFSLYVFHMPFLYLSAAILGSFRATLGGGTIMLGASLAACFALAPLTDLRKREWLTIIRWLIPPRKVPAG